MTDMTLHNSTSSDAQVTPKKTALDQLSSNAVDVPPSITRVLANKAMGIEGLIPLWFGEPNQPTPKFICDEAARAMQNGETFYAEGLGRPFLRQAIADYSSRIYNTEIPSERIAVTVSGGNAINLAFQALLKPGDKVATITPAFGKDFSFVSAGLSGLYIFGDNEKVDFFGYLGNHLLLIDGNSLYNVGLGAGFKFEFVKLLNLNLQAGYGVFDLTNDPFSNITGEIGFYYQF